jgi:endonuclease/exonuclease/phosphatase family metal-dependent hydrolase
VTTPLRVLTLNFAHGGRRAAHQAVLSRATVLRNLRRAARVLHETRPDLVALQEADGPSVWSGGLDHVEAMARLGRLRDHYRGEHSRVALGPLRLSYGTALLSRLPLRERHSHRFGSCWRDTKGFVLATVPVGGRGPAWSGLEIDVVSVHLDFLARRLRRRQVGQLARALAGRTNPRIVLGDLNCCWGRERETLELLAEALDLEIHDPDGAAPTYPARNPRRRLDWILVSRELELLSYRTLVHPLSDHLAVLGTVRPRTASMDCSLLPQDVHEVA